jgi:Mg2+ and Co2+ transporter CorA
LGWQYGYPFALGLMAAITGTGYWFFRRKDWL